MRAHELKYRELKTGKWEIPSHERCIPAPQAPRMATEAGENLTHGGFDACAAVLLVW
jgi:hypothetical protein